MEETKVCADCGTEYPLTKFNSTSGGSKPGTPSNGKVYRANSCNRCRRMKYRYGLTRQEHRDMMVSVGNCCPGCGKPFISESAAVVDHCHTSGVVRGVLCNPCNTAIGYAIDNPETLRRLASYLEVHREQA